MQPDMGSLWRMEMLRKLREAEAAAEPARPRRRRGRRRSGSPGAPPPSAGGNGDLDLTDRSDDVAIPEEETSPHPCAAGSPASPRTSWATVKAVLAAGTPA